MASFIIYLGVRCWPVMKVMPNDEGKAKSQYLLIFLCFRTQEGDCLEEGGTHEKGVRLGVAT